MTAEFGRQFGAYRKAKFPIRTDFAHRVQLDPGFITHIEKGEKNVMPKTAERLAESLGVPLNERARFFLRGSGFSEERIATALDSSNGVYVTTDLPQGEYITAGTHINMYMSGKYSSDSKLARAVNTDKAMIWRLRHGERTTRAPLAEKLLKALEIPQERQAKFLLLVIGHRPEVVHQVLTARATVPQSDELEEGKALVL